MNYVAHISPVQPVGIPHQSPPAHLSQPPGCSFLPWDCQWLLFFLAFQDLKIPAAGEMVKSWLYDACPTLEMWLGFDPVM